MKSRLFFLLIILLCVTWLSAGCANDGAGDSPEGVIKTENLVVPATFQEMLGLFQEADQTTMDAGEEVSYNSYTYEGTEEVNGIEADLVEFYAKHADDETWAKVWFDADGNIVQHELETEEFSEEYAEEYGEMIVENIADPYIFFRGFLPSINQFVFRVINDETEDPRYSLLGSRNERFGDMEVAVYSIGKWRSYVGEETPPTKFDIADFGDFQTIISLELTEDIIAKSGGLKVIIEDVVLR